MNTTKKILLIVIPVLIVIIFAFYLAFRNLYKTIDKKVEQIENSSKNNEVFENNDSVNDVEKSVYGNGNVIKEYREIGDFNKIILKGAFEIALIESDSTYLEVETDENIHECIVSKVDNDGTLELEIIHKPKLSNRIFSTA